jgi:ABC-type Zn2+ transport system substrate-binding protein/surface adhesin
MTSPAKQIAIDSAAELIEDARSATLAAQEAEADERAAVAEIKARLVSVFHDAYGVAEVIRP